MSEPEVSEKPPDLRTALSTCAAKLETLLENLKSQSESKLIIFQRVFQQSLLDSVTDSTLKSQQVQYSIRSVIGIHIFR